MKFKEASNDKMAVPPVCDDRCSEEANAIMMEEKSTPLHRRVQEAARTAWAGEGVAVAISDVLGPNSRNEWNIPVGSYKNPFWKLTRKVSSPSEVKNVLSKSLTFSCTLGSAQLVKNLLEAGAEPNSEPGRWGPVHSAAYGGNAEVMRILLEDPRTSADVIEKNGKTALHLAAGKGNYEVLKILLERSKIDINAVDENGYTALHSAGMSSMVGEVPTDRFLKCITLLMNRPHIKLNKPDKDGLTALSHIVMLSRKDMIKTMMKHNKGSFLNVDTFLGGYYGKTIREAILHMYPDLEQYLPQYHQENLDSPIPANGLLASLQKGDMKIFHSILKNRSVKLNHWYDEPYYCTIVEIASQMKDREQFFKELLQAGANPNTVNPITTQSLLHLAAKRGNPLVLKYLLEMPNININIKDSSDRTPLHCLARVRCGNENESRNLKQSISLLFGENQITNEKPDLTAITSNGETPLHVAAHMGDEETVLTLLKHGANIMYKASGIQPPITYIDPKVMERFLDECIVSNDESPVQEDYMLTFDYNFLNPEKESKSSRKSERKEPCDPEMPPIKFLSGKNRFRHLLKHPVIESFLILKWRKVRLLYCTNFLFYSLFLAVLTWYNFFITENKRGNEQTAALCILSTLLSLLILRELYQFFMSPKTYLQHSNNWLLWVTLLTTLDMCLDRVVDLIPQCNAIALLIAWTQFVALIGGFPKLSIPLEMLKTVALTFFTFIICYSPLFFAFSISFYSMFKNTNSTEDKFFSVDFGMTMLKTFIMFAGEFEASDIPFEEAQYVSHIIFTIFVFLISIVLLNLLNGLAVSDAQAIRRDAEILSLKARVKLISYMEKMTSARIRYFSVLEQLPNKRLRTFPNRKEGNVEVNGTRIKNIKLDVDTVQEAINVVSKRKERSSQDENEITNKNEEVVQHRLEEMSRYQQHMKKEIYEIKKQLDHLSKANIDVRVRLDEILTAVLK